MSQPVTDKDVTNLIWSKTALSRPSNFFFQGEKATDQELFICSVLPPPKFKTDSRTGITTVVKPTMSQSKAATLFAKPNWCVTIGTSYEKVREFLVESGITPLSIIKYAMWKEFCERVSAQEAKKALPILGIPDIQYLKNKQYVVLVGEKHQNQQKAGDGEANEDRETDEKVTPTKILLMLAPVKPLAVLASKKSLSSHNQTKEDNQQVMRVLAHTDLTKVSQVIEQILEGKSVVMVRLLDSRSGKITDQVALSLSRRFPNLSPEEIAENDRKEDEEMFTWYEELKNSSDPEDQWRAERYKGLFPATSKEFHLNSERQLAKRIAIIRKLESDTK